MNNNCVDYLLYVLCFIISYLFELFLTFAGEL